MYASCHPNGDWFVPVEGFNISAKPAQKVNKLAVCSLFCAKTYDDCGDLIWISNDTKTVKEIWNRYDTFCEDGLGVNLRYEAFTDRCFAGCAQYTLYIAIIMVAINVFFQCDQI